MTILPGGGGLRNEVYNGGFTIINAPPTNVPFQIQGISSSNNNLGRVASARANSKRLRFKSVSDPAA